MNLFIKLKNGDAQTQAQDRNNDLNGLKQQNNINLVCCQRPLQWFYNRKPLWLLLSNIFWLCTASNICIMTLQNHSCFHIVRKVQHQWLTVWEITRWYSCALFPTFVISFAGVMWHSPQVLSAPHSEMSWPALASGFLQGAQRPDSQCPCWCQSVWGLAILIAENQLEIRSVRIAGYEE